MLFQESSFKIIAKKGVKHKISDLLSREVDRESTIGIQDDFLDAELISIQAVPKWYKDIAHYLATGQTP